MPYPWANGDVLTHTDLNTEIKRPHVCTSSTRPAHVQGLTIYETDTNRVLVSDGTNWNTGRVYAHMGKTDGFQSITSTGSVVITMAAAQVLKGGFTFDNANDALVVPLTGDYRLTLKGYASGGTLHIVFKARLVTGGTVLDQAMTYKNTTSQDRTVGTSSIRPLTAGDKVQMVTVFDTASVSNAWGTNGYDGTYLNLEFLGV